MQLSVTFQDTGFPDVVFTASGESLVKDALQVAADEWGTKLSITPSQLYLRTNVKLSFMLFFMIQYICILSTKSNS